MTSCFLMKLTFSKSRKETLQMFNKELLKPNKKQRYVYRLNRSSRLRFVAEH